MNNNIMTSFIELTLPNNLGKAYIDIFEIRAFYAHHNPTSTAKCIIDFGDGISVIETVEQVKQLISQFIEDGEKDKQAEQLIKDARLGALVRRMPRGYDLRHFEDTDNWVCEGILDKGRWVADTPEAVVKDAIDYEDPTLKEKE